MTLDQVDSCAGCLGYQPNLRYGGGGCAGGAGGEGGPPAQQHRAHRRRDPGEVMWVDEVQEDEGFDGAFYIFHILEFMVSNY